MFFLSISPTGPSDPGKNRPIQALQSRFRKRLGASPLLGQEVLNLVNDLGSESFDVSNNAINKLSEMTQDKSLFTELVKLLNKGEIVSRRSSAKVLGNLKNISAMSFLAGVLKEKDNDLVINSIDALETLVLKNKDTISLADMNLVTKELAACIENNEYYQVSLNAAMLLGQLGKPEAVEMLVSCLQNGDEDVSNRERARDILCGIKHKETLEQVTPFLSDEYSMRTREYSASVVNSLAESNITSIEITDSLMKCLDDITNTRLRRIAAEALGNTRDEKGINSLIKALIEDDDLEVKKTATVAISKFDESIAVPVLWNIFLQIKGPLIKLNTLEALAKTNNPVIVPAFLIAIKDFSIQDTAIQNFKYLSDEVLDKGLKTYLLEEINADNRLYLLESLRYVGDLRVLPYIEKCAEDTDPRIKDMSKVVLDAVRVRQERRSV